MDAETLALHTSIYLFFSYHSYELLLNHIVYYQHSLEFRPKTHYIVKIMN